MTTETLTANERTILGELTGPIPAKAMRIIDQLADALATARWCITLTARRSERAELDLSQVKAELDQWKGTATRAAQTLVTAEAQVRELEAVVVLADRALTARDQQLAAASALLGSFSGWLTHIRQGKHCYDGCLNVSMVMADLIEMATSADAHLSAYPAAPDPYEHCECPAAHECQPAAPTAIERGKAVERMFEDESTDHECAVLERIR